MKRLPFVVMMAIIVGLQTGRCSARSVGRVSGGREGRQVYGRSQASKNDSASTQKNATQKDTSTTERD